MLRIINLNAVGIILLLCVLCTNSSVLQPTMIKSSFDVMVNSEKGTSTSKPFRRSLERLVEFRGGRSSVLHITSVDDFNKVVNESNGKLIVIDFTAAWCGPCKMIAPIYEEMSQEFSEGCLFLKIDVDEIPDLAEHFQVQAMPTFVFMKSFDEVGRFSGASVDKLREMITNNI